MASYDNVAQEIDQSSGGGSQSGLLGYTIEGQFRVVDPDDPARFFVRFPNGNFVSALHQSLVPQTPNRPVLVSNDRLGRPVILGDDPTRISAFLGGGSGGSGVGSGAAAPVGYHTHVRGSGMEFIVDPWMLKYLRVSRDSGLTIKVAAGWYSYNGALIYFPETTFDLTSYIAADSGFQGWIKVGINPVSSSVVAVAGVETYGSFPMDVTLIDNITFEALGYIPLAAIWVNNGQAQIEDYQFYDLRFPPRQASAPVALAEQSGDPALIATRWQLFAKSGGLYQESLAGAVLRLLTSADLSGLSGTYQPLDADLTAIAALTRFDGKFIVSRSGAWAVDTLQVTDIPTLTSAKISDFDAQVRTSTLNQMAAPSADLSINSHKLTNVTDPGSAQDAATKAYVDTHVGSGLPVFGSGVSKTESSDKVAAGSDRSLVVSAQTGTADNLIEVTGLSVGDVCWIYPASGHTLTVKSNDSGATDKIFMAGGTDVALTGNMGIQLFKQAAGVVIGLVNAGAAGAVTSVTASSPLASSGGTTPDISLNSAVPLNKGGTAVDLSASGGTKKVLAQDASQVISARDLVAGDIPDLSGTYQPLDADLTAIAALTRFDGKFIVSRSGAWAVDTVLSADLTTPLLTPPAIGATTPAAGKFTTLEATDILTTGSGAVRKVRVVTAAGAVTVATTDDVIVVNKTSGAATTVNLPSSPTTGQTFTIEDGKGDAATNNITVAPAAGNINGSATKVLSQNYACVVVTYNGTQWNAQVIANVAASGGTVTSVTASSPLASSGGTTPDISLNSAVPLSKGGTNADLSAAGGATKVLAQDAGQVISARDLVTADIATALTTPGAIGGTTPASGKFTTLESTGILTTGSGRAMKLRLVTAAGAVTVATTDEVVVVNKTVGAATVVNLPSTPATGLEFVIHDGKGDAATNPLTLTPSSGNINGAATLVVSVAYGTAFCWYDGAQWQATVQAGSVYYQTVRDNGTDKTQRAAVNFHAGSNVTLTIADDSGNNETDVTIASNPTASNTLATNLFLWQNYTF